jgi:MATE family multidrug resistance protein
MGKTRQEEEESKAPLLEPRPQPAAPAAGEGSGSEAEQEAEEGLGRRLLDENRKLWKVAGPSICTRFSTFGVTVISQAFVGHIGPTELAAYALVSTVLMRFSNGILVTPPTTNPIPFYLLMMIRDC